SLKIYKNGNNQNQPHYASALAGYAQVQYARKEYSDAVKAYSEALDLIAQCYGKDSESYAITLENLQQAQDAAEKFTETNAADAIQ
ncbi:tetratricopeptide repeat protein, partial [Escherichia coli]|nr:tetratricopeptide repeat protein [Escherichia coli]